MVHPRELPNLLDVSRDVLGAMVDLEAVVDLRCSLSGDRIEEPVRVLHVLTRGPKELPSSRQDLVRCLDDLPLGPRLGTSCRIISGRKGCESEDPESSSRGRLRASQRGPRRLSWDLGYDLPGGPPSTTHMFRDRAISLRRRTSSTVAAGAIGGRPNSSRGPPRALQGRSHSGCSVEPLTAEAAARVARVVAESDSSEMGIGSSRAHGVDEGLDLRGLTLVWGAEVPTDASAGQTRPWRAGSCRAERFARRSKPRRSLWGSFGAHSSGR